MRSLPGILCGAALGGVLSCAPALANDTDLAALSRLEQARAAAQPADDRDDTTYVLVGDQPAPLDRAALMLRVRAAHRKRHPTCRVKSPGGSEIGTVYGVVTDQSGAPLSDVTVQVQGRGKMVTSRTNRQGQYRVVLDAGEYAVTLVPADPSLDTSWVAARRVTLQRALPQQMDFVVRVHRTATGATSAVR